MSTNLPLQEGHPEGAPSPISGCWAPLAPPFPLPSAPSSAPSSSARRSGEGTEPLPAPHLPPHPPCALPFSFHSHVNSSPPRAKKKERTWPRCRKCSPVCQGEERREIKANKTSKSKIPKPPLGHPAAVKVNTGNWQRRESPSRIKPRQLWSLGWIDQARLHFQGRDGRPRQTRLFC